MKKFSYNCKSYPHGIMFHHFHDEDCHPHIQGSINASTFDAVLDFIDFQRILSPQDWLNRSIANALQPSDVCLTFDDTLRCQLDVALPVLEAHNVHAFFFVSSSILQGIPSNLEIYRYVRNVCFEDLEEFYTYFNNVIEQSIYAEKVQSALQNFVPSNYLKAYAFYTNEDRIHRYIRDHVLGSEAYEMMMDGVVDSLVEDGRLDLSTVTSLLWLQPDDITYLHNSGHCIGLHSHTHPTNLQACNYREQLNEYSTNASYLQSILSHPSLAMSHPCNSYNEDTLQILSNLGIKLGFRSDMVEAKSLLEMPRQDHSQIVAMMHDASLD